MKIVTHRFRGFSEKENSYDGFKNALESGVMVFEFDIRLTSDGIPVVNHDRFIKLEHGDQLDIVTNTYNQLIDSTGGSHHLNSIMSLDEALELFSRLKKDESKIFIDIKDFGEEEAILAMINRYSVKESTVIVSWLPEVLFRIHELDPGIPLCFSHNYIRSSLHYNLMKKILSNKVMRSVIGSVPSLLKPSFAEDLENIDFFFEDYNGRKEVPARNISSKRDFEHTLNGPVSGELYDAINRSNGFLCIQYRMLHDGYASLYSKSPSVIPYSINDRKILKRLPVNMECPYILSDNPDLVSRF